MASAVLQSIRSKVPSQHQAAFDAAVGRWLPSDEPRASGILQQLLALLASLGLTINWPCLIAEIPQIILAFSNPALIVTIIQNYLACCNPVPPPTPVGT